jgi:hypothetical protein
MSVMTVQRWQTGWDKDSAQSSKGIGQAVSTATSGIDLVADLLFRLRRDQAEVVGHYSLQSIVLPETNLRPQNRKALALLEAWMSEPDDLGQEWWDDFKQGLQQDRFSLREIE